MYIRRKRIEKCISLVLSVLILLMSVGCSNSPPKSEVSEPDSSVITETTETEIVQKEEIIIEHITSEVYINEIVEVENKITELLLDEETISEVLLCKTIYVPESNIDEFSKNSQAASLFGNGIDLSAVLKKISVGTGVILTLAILKKVGFSNPVASIVNMAADKSLKFAASGALIGSLFGGVTGAADAIDDESGRVKAITNLALAVVGLILTAIPLLAPVPEGGVKYASAQGVKLLIARIAHQVAVMGTLKEAYNTVKTFTSTDCFDINWNNMSWEKVGVSTVQKAIDGGATGYMSGAFVGAVYGGIEGYEFFHKYHTPYTEYNQRIMQTPKEGSGGHWTKTRGESDFVLDKPIELPDGTKITKVTYKNGVPDFSPYAKAEVKIPKMTNNRFSSGGNYEQADKALAEYWTKTKYQNKSWTSVDVKNFRENYPCKLTWHEMSNMESMQLVPYDVNSTFGHYGGVAEYNAMIRSEGALEFD